MRKDKLEANEISSDFTEKLAPYGIVITLFDWSSASYNAQVLLSLPKTAKNLCYI